MAELSELLGDEREIRDFIIQERPFWPNEPTRCPVPVCTEVYARFSNFQRHWQQKHERTKTSYTCPCCERKFWRQDVAKAHLRKKHNLIASLLIKEERNIMFVDPGQMLPYRMNHRERLRSKRQQQETPGESLVTSAADCRDEEVVFDQEGNTTGKRFKSSKTSSS